ncbi:MAG: hypothetical protein QM648_01935 [Solirubrobacterales bacterium]
MKRLALLLAVFAAIALLAPAAATSRKKTIHDYGKCPSWGTTACRYQVSVNTNFTLIKGLLLNLVCKDSGWVDVSSTWDEDPVIKKSGSFSASVPMFSGNDYSNDRLESVIHFSGMVHKSKKGYKKTTITFKWKIDAIASKCDKYKTGKETFKYIRSR